MYVVDFPNIFNPGPRWRHGFHPMDINAMIADYDPEGEYVEEQVAEMIEEEIRLTAKQRAREEKDRLWLEKFKAEIRKSPTVKAKPDHHYLEYLGKKKASEHDGAQGVAPRPVGQAQKTASRSA